MQYFDQFNISLTDLADPSLVLHQLTLRGAEITKHPVEDRTIEARTADMTVSDFIHRYLTDRKFGSEPSIADFEVVAGIPKIAPSAPKTRRAILSAQPEGPGH